MKQMGKLWIAIGGAFLYIVRILLYPVRILLKTRGFFLTCKIDSDIIITYNVIHVQGTLEFKYVTNDEKISSFSIITVINVFTD